MRSVHGISLARTRLTISKDRRVISSSNIGDVFFEIFEYFILAACFIKNFVILRIIDVLVVKASDNTRLRDLDTFQFFIFQRFHADANFDPLFTSRALIATMLLFYLFIHRFEFK